MRLPDTITALLNAPQPISDFGEKRLIREIIRPLFNPTGARWGVGDDAALLQVAPGASVLASTDRVPADLIAFQQGLIDHKLLGAYLARLNLSDIAACGGRPIGLLLNMGLPGSLPISSFIQLLVGALDVCERFACPVVGGDLSDSQDLSLSATALGEVERKSALARDTAKAGDTVFVSRPIGLTPAAFSLLRLPSEQQMRISEEHRALLWGQFRSCDPMFALASRLVASGACSSCMDNTDGLAQSFQELADASGVAIVLDQQMALPDIVHSVAAIAGEMPLSLALGPGADFALVGTMRGNWSEEDLVASIGPEIRKIGRVSAGEDVHISDGTNVERLTVRGWNYYANDARLPPKVT